MTSKKNVEPNSDSDDQAELEAAVLKLESAKALPKVLRDRIDGVLKTHEDAEAKDFLINTLKPRFESHVDWHPGLTWAEVERSIGPKELTALKIMEETGGEPDLLAVERGFLIFADCSDETPSGRRGLTRDQCVEQAHDMGVSMMTEELYRLLKNRKPVDRSTSSWLRPPVHQAVEVIELPHGRFETRDVDEDMWLRAPGEDLGWRGVLWVPMVK